MGFRLEVCCSIAGGFGIDIQFKTSVRARATAKATARAAARATAKATARPTARVAARVAAKGRAGLTCCHPYSVKCCVLGCLPLRQPTVD